LLIYQEQREQNEYSRNLKYLDHQNNCTRGLVIRYKEVFWTG